MRPGDWVQIVGMVLILAGVFFGLVRALSGPARSPGARMSRRIAAGVVIRRILRASDVSRWN